MKLSQVLLEYKRDITLIKLGGRLEVAGEKDRGRKSEEILDVLEGIDSTKNKQYVEWLVRQYIAGRFRVEDAGRVKTVLGQFINVKNKLEEKDINRYTFHELESKMDAIHDVQLDNGEDDLDDDDFKVLYAGPLGVLSIPLTQEASCELGRGTKWCTAAKEDNMFDHYNEDGPLYIWRDKSGKKFQFHFATRQFMNDKDISISAAEFKYFREENPVTAKMFVMGEREIIADMGNAKDYMQEYLRGQRFKVFERELIDSDNYREMFWYSKEYGKRIPEFEEAILKSQRPSIMVDYVQEIIKGEWFEAEEYISKRAAEAGRYAIVVGRRFEEWEDVIKEGGYIWQRYKEKFNIKNS